ncbi:MAG: hypothetical protein WD270_06675 [Acetobacterales bacterium]
MQSPENAARTGGSRAPASSRRAVALALMFALAPALAGCSDVRTPWSGPELPGSIPPPPAALRDDRLAVASHCSRWATRAVERRTQDLRDRDALDMSNTSPRMGEAIVQDRALRDREALYRACMDQHAPTAPPPVEPRVVPRT